MPKPPKDPDNPTSVINIKDPELQKIIDEDKTAKYMLDKAIVEKWNEAEFLGELVKELAEDKIHLGRKIYNLQQTTTTRLYM
jgi:hypothetical protein